jgi:hypothetical protein
VLGENGITLRAGDTWHLGDLSLIGQGVVALSNKVGGADNGSYFDHNGNSVR